jgi:hypothetical protein
MQTLITRWPQFGFNSSDTTSGVALTLVFEPDYVGVTLTGGRPAVTFNNSAPPDAGLVPAHIPSNAAADSWVSHQIPAAGQNVDVGSVVTLQLQAGVPL